MTNISGLTAFSIAQKPLNPAGLARWALLMLPTITTHAFHIRTGQVYIHDNSNTAMHTKFEPKRSAYEPTWAYYEYTYPNLYRI